MNEAQDTVNMQDVISIQEVVHNLDVCDALWKEHFEQAIMGSNDSDDEGWSNTVSKMVYELIFIILNMQKQFIDDRDEEKELAFFNEMTQILGENIVKIIEERNSGILEIYRNIRPLRKAGEQTINLLIGAFECASVHYVPDYIEKCKEYGMDEDEFKTLVLQLDRIISIHVSRYYDKQTAQKEFLKVTGLDRSYGAVYAELYEKYFERLQHNICLDKLDILSEQMDDLTKQIADLAKQISNMQNT